MATYAEIFNIQSNDSLKNKVAIACIVAAEAIRLEAPATPNNVNRLLWAKEVFRDPKLAAESMMWAVLAANNGLTVAQIEGATDAAIQSKIDDAVNIFATG